MQFEKINKDKIRIIFSIQDLKEKNINYHDFMANPTATQSLFLDMLNQAEKEIGFVTDNYQLMIETLASSDGFFILTVTRTKKNNVKKVKAVSKPVVKPKTLSLNKPLPTLIYRFDNFDNFYDLCKFIAPDHKKNLSKTFTKAVLYSYKDAFFLLVKTNSKADIKDVKHVLSLVMEFCSSTFQPREVFQNTLTEHGKVLVRNNCFLKLGNK